MFKQTLIASSIIIAASAYAQTEAPNTFTSGTAISAAEMNANFDAMEAGINANATQVSSNTTQVDANVTAISNLNTSLDALTQTVADLQTQVDNIQSGSGSVNLQEYVGSGVYQVFFRDQEVNTGWEDLCTGMTTLVFNSDGSLQDGVVDNNSTPDDESDDVILSGSAGEELCVEKHGGTFSGVYRGVWADVGSTWSISGQDLTLTFIEQLQDGQGRDLYTDGSNAELYSQWGASNNANPSQYFEDLYVEYVEPNGYHSEWTENPDGTSTAEIWATFTDYQNANPPMETWTNKEHFFYVQGDVIFTGDESSLTEKLGPVSETIKVTANGNMLVKQSNEGGNDYHSSELIIGIRVGNSTP